MSTGQQSMDRHAQAMSQFNQKREEGDIDLIDIVRNELVNAGLGQKLQAGYDNNRFIIDAKDKPSSVQRYFLNRYWNIQLMSSEKPSTEERFCLVPNGTNDDWLRLFKSKVLPFIIENGLPKVI